MVFLLIVQLIKLLPELVMSVVEPIPGLRCAFDFSMWVAFAVIASVNKWGDIQLFVGWQFLLYREPKGGGFVAWAICSSRFRLQGCLTILLFFFLSLLALMASLFLDYLYIIIYIGPMVSLTVHYTFMCNFLLIRDMYFAGAHCTKRCCPTSYWDASIPRFTAQGDVGLCTWAVGTGNPSCILSSSSWSN